MIKSNIISKIEIFFFAVRFLFWFFIILLIFRISWIFVIQQKIVAKIKIAQVSRNRREKTRL